MEVDFTTHLHPPHAFGIVEQCVYRSNMPIHANFSFLRKLQLRTALVLSPEKPLREFEEFVQENKIELVSPRVHKIYAQRRLSFLLFQPVLMLQIHLGLEAWHPNTSWKPVRDELIKEGLEIILDETRYPIVVICT